MNHLIHLIQARYIFPSGGAVGPIDLHVNAGELVVLAGPTGSGKSTVARMVVGLTQRHGHGQVSGEVRVAGRDPGSLSGAERVQTTGFVGQEVDDCVLAGTCAGEVAFALESAGLGADAVGPALARVGLRGFEERDPLGISGGERQRLVIAAALAARPRVLVLDEPLSQLDPAGAEEIVGLLRAIADEGVAVLLVEHRLNLLGRADRIVRLGAGADDVFHVERGPQRAVGASVVALRGLGYAHPGICGRGIHGVSLAVQSGERVAVVGGNGAGKSTLLGLISGRLKPASGAVVHSGRVVEVPQNADLVLFAATAVEEVRYGPVEYGVAVNAPALLTDFGLAGLDHRAPQALSRGQRLRLAVVASLAAEPDVLVLDEAGSGQDVANLGRLFAAVGQRAKTTVFSSHDPALVAAWATRVVWLEGGCVVEDRPVAESTWRGQTVAGARGTTPHIPAVADEQGGAAGLDPRLRLLLVAVLGLVVILLETALPLALLAAALVGAALVHPRVRPWRRSLVLGALLVAWSTAFSQALFWAEWPRTSLLQVGPLRLWREGAVHGLAQSTRFISLTAGGLLLAASTATDRVVTALRSPVGRLRLPYALAIMIAAMVRFVPLVASEWAQVRIARRSRGRAIWRRPPHRWLLLEIALLRPVVARCIRRARMLAESLETRGFDANAPRAVVSPLVWRPLDSAVLGGALGMLGLIVSARVLYGLYTADIWYHSGLRPLYAFVRAWL